MNNAEEKERDILSRYITRESTEKAPEGFTGRIMTRIRLEKAPVDARRIRMKRLIIPAATMLLTSGLIIVASLTGSSVQDPVSKAIISFLDNISISFPVLKASSMPQFSVPSIVFYLAISLFFLLFFDWGLRRFFNRRQDY